MPKVSKVKPPKVAQEEFFTRKGAMKRVPPNGFMCTRCGSVFPSQNRNFPKSRSEIYQANDGFLTVCCLCVDEMYLHYRSILPRDEDAVFRVCQRFGIYWSKEIYDMVDKSSRGKSRIRSYISKTNLYMFNQKTYEDTISEGQEQEMEQAVIREMARIQGERKLATGQYVPEMIEGVADAAREDGDAAAENKADFEPYDVVTFWGPGFTEDVYAELNQRYKRWTKGLPNPLEAAEEALYKQICLQETNINRNLRAGKSIEQGQNALNQLLGSLNAKPVQRKNDGDDEQDLYGTPLGVWGKRLEEDRPIPDDDELRSSSKIIEYIHTWFFGHIGKMLGLKNLYSKMYDEAIQKYSVEKPEMEDDDDIISALTSEGDIEDDSGDDDDET